MKNNKRVNFNFQAINSFSFDINYCQVYSEKDIEQFEMHTHNELELYIAIEGDVSFLVNNNLYPTGYGDIIVSRPGEHHHCVCHSKKDRNFFCIWFEYEQNGFLKEFFENKNIANLISPEKSQKTKLIDLCFKLTQENLGICERYNCFFNLLNIIASSEIGVAVEGKMPQNLKMALDFIDEHISENIQVCDIARFLFVSESTIERRFKEYLKIKPLEYIRKVKMSKAAQLLKSGETVLDTGLAVGYFDNSYFIKLFKQYYGVTPHKFKKNYNG